MSGQLIHWQGPKGGEVFVDALMPCRQNAKWKYSTSCHLFTLPGWEDDLHAFAQLLELRRAWFQENSVMPHYDLTDFRRHRAVRAGAREMDRADTVGVIRQWRASSQLVLKASLEGQGLVEEDASAKRALAVTPDLGLPDDAIATGFARCREILKK